MSAKGSAADGGWFRRSGWALVLRLKSVGLTDRSHVAGVPTRLACGATAVVLWGLALCCSWFATGIAQDGSYVLVEAVRTGTFLPYDSDPRFFPNFISLVPVVAALGLGVHDLHWLARLFSVGLFVLPLASYSLALLRTRDDALLAPPLIAAIAMVFLSTSFFIQAEHNAAYALALLAAVWLLTSAGLGYLDGLVLALVALLATRSYEAFVYLGPLLAALTVWTVWRAERRPAGAVALYLLAALLFLAGAWIAARSIAGYDRQYLDSVLFEAQRLRLLLPLVACVGAALLVLGCSLLWPRAVLGRALYVAGGVPLALLALSPLLAAANVVMHPPYAYWQCAGRTAAGLIVAGTILFMWLAKAEPRWKPALFAVLKLPLAARHLLLFAFAMLVATLPWYAVMTRLFVGYLDLVQQTIAQRGGVISYEEAGLGRHPRLLQGDGWQLTSLSLVLRSAPTDGVIAAPVEWAGFRPYPVADPPRLGDFLWRSSK